MTVQQAHSPELVWSIYKALSEQCEHFNGLESSYRTLASTWLLAAFAGMGFVLKEIHTGQQLLLVAGIAAVAAIGILLLWLLDQMVYHRLLSAAFAEQLALERQHAWLPQVAHRMMQAHGNTGVTSKVVWFYVATYALLAAIASFTAVLGFMPTASLALQLGSSVGCFIVFGASVALYMWWGAIAQNSERVELEKG